MPHEVDEATGEIVKYDPTPAEIQVHSDPVENFRKMRELVSEVSKACTGPKFRANIQGKDYPTVQWWTSVGAALGMFPYEVRSEKITDEKGNMAYESFVEVRRNGLAITSASAMCSTGERTWSNRDEYAVKSMATTRATAKAYRLGLSFLAVMAGLEATPAEEMPRDGGYFNGRAKPAAPPVSQAQRDAQAALVQLHDSAEDRIKYVEGVLGKPVGKPSDLTEEEWEQVKQAAVDELAMASTSEQAEMEVEA